MYNLSDFMSGFTNSGKNLASIAKQYITTTAQVQVEALSLQARSWVVGMVDEYSTLSSGQRALTVTKNIIYLAFCLRAMLEEVCSPLTSSKWLLSLIGLL